MHYILSDFVECFKSVKLTPMSLSTKIFVGLFLGIATGLFFGEMVAFLKPVGDLFVQLLKMAVLPYILVALISGLGRLNYSEAKTLFLRVGAILLLIWGVTFALLLVLPLTFPKWETASFFSTTLLTQPEPFDFLQFIPANPFHSLANSVVPAVVLFSIAVGVALMGIERKQPLIDNLEILGDALTRVMKFVMRLTPVGVFAIAASAAGTMPFKELGQLQVYMLTYIGAALLMTFCVLPALITMFTPVSFREVITRIKEPMVTAFATDNLLIVLPILADQGKELIRRSNLESEDPESAVDVIVPASFNFPHAGKLLQLSFVLFAAWFTSTAISVLGYVDLMVSGLFSFFGKPVVAMPFLLDLLRIPADMFELYLASGIMLARFGTLVSVMQTFALAVLGAFAMAGALRFRFKSFLSAILLTAPLLVVFVLGARFYYSYALENAYDKDQIIGQMQTMENTVPMKVSRTPLPPLKEDVSRPALERIRERGYLRVGYFGDFMPFDYFNARGEFVGFDVAMAQNLATELGVGLEFVPVKRGQLAEALNTGVCDIIMSAIAVTPERAEMMAFSMTYLDLTLTFMVKDHRRDEFDSYKDIRSLTKPRIAIPNLPYWIAVVRRRVPNAEVIVIDHVREFLEDREGKFDALAHAAEIGSAWSLLYPQYTIVIPQPEVVNIPVAYPVALNQPEWAAFVSAWVELKKKDGTIKRLYDYWILGRNAVPQKPRWSVIRDVLHWVDEPANES